MFSAFNKVSLREVYLFAKNKFGEEAASTKLETVLAEFAKSLNTSLGARENSLLAGGASVGSEQGISPIKGLANSEHSESDPSKKKADGVPSSNVTPIDTRNENDSSNIDEGDAVKSFFKKRADERARFLHVRHSSDGMGVDHDA